MNWLDKLLGRTPTLDDLIAENQRLAREQDAIRDRRRALRIEIDKHNALRNPVGMNPGEIAKGN